LSWLARIVIEFFRGVPSLLLIYFFFLVIPQYGIKMSSFWMITLPVALAASIKTLSLIPTPYVFLVLKRLDFWAFFSFEPAEKGALAALCWYRFAAAVVKSDTPVL
jgi:hypothetical protein